VAAPVRRAHAPAAADWRDHFGVWVLVMGLVLAAYTLASPSPLSLADPSARPRFLSIGAGALLVVLLLWRACGASSPSFAPSPSPSPSSSAWSSRWSPIVAALLGVLTVALSRSLWRATMTAGPAAIGALLAVVVLALAEWLVRRPADVRAGVGLALVAGAATGGPLAAAALGWPLGALVVARASRRHYRWPAWAAAIFAVVATLAALGLGAWARGPAPSHLSDLAGRLFLVPIFRALAHLSMEGLARAASELVDQVGILGLLVAATGLPRLRRTSLVFTFWPLCAGLTLRAVLGNGPEGTIGLIVAASSLPLPLAAGMVRLGERLGRAAPPAVAVIGVIVAIWPLLAN
jgi:hypothetical protein